MSGEQVLGIALDIPIALGVAAIVWQVPWRRWREALPYWSPIAVMSLSNVPPAPPVDPYLLAALREVNEIAPNDE